MISILTSASVLALLSLKAVAATSIDNKTFEYIVVGSGPGGGPLASNLARAGHSVLLLEAGDDQTENGEQLSRELCLRYVLTIYPKPPVNVSQWINFNSAGNDPATVRITSTRVW
jgi:choline dehydrogenase